MTILFRQNLRAHFAPRRKNYGLSHTIDENIQAWLTLPGSLTRHLKQCFTDFKVHIVDESWQKPMRHEAKVLGLAAHHQAWVRTVHLMGAGQARVYARTIVPVKTLKRLYYPLKHLSTRPLGEFLFCHPKMRRSKFIDLSLKPARMNIDMAIDGISLPEGERIFGRGSVFTIHQCPLLVSEYFIAPMPALSRRMYQPHNQVMHQQYALDAVKDPLL